MKRILMTAAGVVFSAAAAQASLVITETVGGSTVAKQNGTYTPITFKLTGVNGADTTLGPSSAPAGVLVLSGTFTATNGGIIAVPGNSTSSDPGYYQNFVTNGKYGIGTINSDGYGVNAGDGEAFNYVASGANFPSITPSTLENYRTNVTGASSILDDLGAVAEVYGNATSFTDSWYSSSALAPGTNVILAKIYVTAGDDVNFTGVYSTYGSSLAPVTFGAAVPEPTTLTLLGFGVLPILTRRRRRKA